MEKNEKKQIKADCAELRKIISKVKPEKMTGADISNIRSAMLRVERSGANAVNIAAQEL